MTEDTVHPEAAMPFGSCSSILNTRLLSLLLSVHKVAGYCCFIYYFDIPEHKIFFSTSMFGISFWKNGELYHKSDCIFMLINYMYRKCEVVTRLCNIFVCAACSMSTFLIVSPPLRDGLT